MWLVAVLAFGAPACRLAPHSSVFRRRDEKEGAGHVSTIYVIEDDDSLREGLARILEIQGYQVEQCRDFPDAAREAERVSPDLVLLDLSLPGTDGHALCRSIRARSSVPIIVLTSSTSEFDEITSLRLGADGFLTKPYSPMVLLAHVERALSRGSADASVLAWNGLSLDIARSCARHGDGSVELARNESLILAQLLRAKGGIVSRQDLMFVLWQSDQFVDDNTLTVNVNRLRGSLSRLGLPRDFLKTHRGQGYSL